MIGTKEERNAQSLASIAKSLEKISNSLEQISNGMSYDHITDTWYFKVGTN